MSRPSDASIARAKRFHEAYERLAPQFGYETRTNTREFDPESPNGRLMIAVCDELDTSPEAREGDCDAAASSPPLDEHPNASYRGAEIDLCEVAAEVERVLIDRVISEVEAITQDRTDAFYSGMSMACEEIKTRLDEAWGLTTKATP